MTFFAFLIQAPFSFISIGGTTRLFSRTLYAHKQQTLSFTCSSEVEIWDQWIGALYEMLEPALSHWLHKRLCSLCWEFSAHSESCSAETRWNISGPGARMTIHYSLKNKGVPRCHRRTFNIWRTSVSQKLLRVLQIIKRYIYIYYTIPIELLKY